MTYNIPIQWPLVLFSVIAGTGGVLAAFIGLSEIMGKAKEARFKAALVSLICMVVGGCCSVAHLALPQNMMAAATNIFSFSGVSVELIMLGITFIVVLVYAILVKRENAGAAKIVAIIGIIAGLLLAFVCGHGYVIDSRPLWDTELLPLAYLGSVLPAGGFLFVALAKISGVEGEEVAAFNPALIAAVVLSVVSMLAYLLFVGTKVMSSDPAASYFAVIVCGIVGVVACLIVLFASKGKSVVLPIACVACVLALIGGIGLRAVMWDASEPFFNAWYIEANDLNIGTDWGFN